MNFIFSINNKTFANKLCISIINFILHNFDIIKGVLTNGTNCSSHKLYWKVEHPINLRKTLLRIGDTEYYIDDEYVTKF